MSKADRTRIANDFQLDQDKIENFLLKALLPFSAEDKERCVLFNVKNVYRECQLGVTPTSKFVSVLNDVLSSTRIFTEVGCWVVAELEGPVFVMFRVHGPIKGRPGQLESWVAEEVSAGRIGILRCHSTGYAKSWSDLGL